MPRQTKAQYYHIHQQLRRLWLDEQGLFAEISPKEQWLLHDYFKPDMDWSREQLLAHRVDITKRRPGLPQQAGRAYANFLSTTAAYAVSRVHAQATPVVRTRGGPRRDRHITVKTVVRPEIDLHKLARALIQQAIEEQRREREGTDSERSRTLE